MDPERWRHVERLYHGALACPAAERAAFLAGACDSDLALREEVERLLDTPGTADGVFAAPALAAAAQMVSDPAVSLLTGRRLGVYQLQERIGAGGMDI